MNNTVEKACCLGCKINLIKDPTVLRVLLITGVTIEKIAREEDCWAVNSLKDSMENERWNSVLEFARLAVGQCPTGSSTRALHKGFGQVNTLRFIKPTNLKLVGSLRMGSVLQIIGRHSKSEEINSLIYAMAVELTQPHMALRMFKNTNLSVCLQSSIIFDLVKETVRVVYPSNAGTRIYNNELPGAGNDIANLRKRVTTCLRFTFRNWRAVFIKNIWGLGSPEEVNSNDGVPVMMGWIETLRKLQKDSWIVFGAVVPNDQRFSDRSGHVIAAEMNAFSNHQNVYYTNLTETSEDRYRMHLIPTWEEICQLSQRLRKGENENI